MVFEGDFNPNNFAVANFAVFKSQNLLLATVQLRRNIRDTAQIQ